MQNIVLDCDGVVLDWYLGFHQWMTANAHAATGPYPTDYGMLDIYPGKTREEIASFIQEFNATPDFSRLQFIDGAKDGIRQLRLLYPAARITFLTAVGDDPVTHCYRRKNLQGLDFDDLITLPLHASKRQWLSRFDSPAMFVEDHPGHAADGADLGLSAYLMDSPWNRLDHHTAVARVSGWPDLLSRHAADRGALPNPGCRPNQAA